MSYFFKTVISGKSFEEVLETVKTGLAKEGFGVTADIDVQNIFKNKIHVNFRKYRILGACNPHYAYLALQQEPQLGVLLPCNVVVQENLKGEIEVAAIDSVILMMPVNNKIVKEIAGEIQKKLKKVIENIS
ncbi:MAG: DUF302 domain-containing protein [Bacteroidales bacterium]|nr:DUF302 domain-containing protein [Bacteroidales bacterium]